MNIPDYVKDDGEILKEMQEESIGGMKKYGGSNPVQNDSFATIDDWAAHIKDHAERAACSATRDARQHLVKVGGLALSAIRAMDAKERKHAETK